MPDFYHFWTFILSKTFDVIFQIGFHTLMLIYLVFPFVLVALLIRAYWRHF